MNKHIITLLIGVLMAFSACKKDDDEGVTINPPTKPNILLIISDDLGKDAINGYNEGSIKPNTPHIDAIRNTGLIFNNFWSYPTCTPTRASIITGKYGYRTNVKVVGDELSLSETSLQKYINDNTNNQYSTAVVGKWHLSGNDNTFNPEIFGIDYYAGLIRAAPISYNNWRLTEDGSSTIQNGYITEVFTDLAIDWVNDQNKPWFLWLAYTAPHTPFHAPPNEMHSQGNLPAYNPGLDATPYYIAAIEAMDFQIGRLLENIPQDELDNTVVIFIGDNGTPNQVTQLPYATGKVKGTLYQGGINVPLFVSGTGVSRTGNEGNLITSTDLFATISELAGISVDQINDSKSFKSLLSQNSAIRNYQYCEDDVDWTISNGAYKLFQNNSGDTEFYNLTNDPYEQNNLLNGTLTTNQQTIKSELETELTNIRQ